VSGHVFHPGHHELHGVTVVIRTTGSRTWIGRFHEQDERGIHLRDAAVHDAAASGQTTDDYLRRAVKFGVRPEQKYVVLPAGEVTEITPLGQLQLD
jgi:hypothetical protein